MTPQYFTVLTDYGTQALAKALATNQPIRLSSFAVGDGNGQAVTPTTDRTALVKETHRANVSAVSLDPRNNKQIIIELAIPEDVGGFYIREMGVFDSANKLVAYANAPESFKPTLESGSGKVQVLRMILKVSNSQAVTLSIDNSVIFITRQQFTPQKITSSTTNGFDESGHAHEIEKADTTKAGIVQLTDDTGLDSDKLGLSARAGKKLAQLISTVQLALGNYIPNNKKSNSVTSTSNDNVATSSAVKTAYDKGVEAKTAADNANQNAEGRVPKTGDTTINGTLRAKNTSGGWSAYQFETSQGFWQLEVHPNSHEEANRRFNMMFIPNIGNRVYLSFPALGNNGEVVAYQSWAVNKAGDTMTGILYSVGISSKHYGYGNYANQYTSGAPFLVNAEGSQDRDTYHPFVKGVVRSKGRYGAGFSLGYTTKQGAGDGFGRGIINLIEDNGTSKNWSFEHNGDFNSAGDIRTSSGKSLNTAVQLSDYRSQWGQTGWVKLPNGLILQWGKTPVIHDERSTDIVFPIAFPNKVLNIQLTENQMRTVEANATHLAALNVTNSKFTFKINSTLPIDSSADWFAIGY
jgi:probable tail fiber protein